VKRSILEDPSNAELLSLNAEDKPQLTPLFSDSIVDEAATNSPISRLKISIDPPSTWEHWQQADYEPPAPGLIENTDSRPTSVKQIIKPAHDYAVPLRRLLCRSCDIWGAENEACARFFDDASLGVWKHPRA
jgi:hypothetical protein